MIFIYGLHQVDDELKKIKNPKLMTVRQRALLERKGELQNEEIIKEELVALPTGSLIFLIHDSEICSRMTTLASLFQVTRKR